MGPGVENGDVNHDCDGLEPGELLWIFTGDPVQPATLHINGNDYSGSQGGGPNSRWHFVTPWFDLDPDVTDASIDYVTDGQLTISHGCPADHDHDQLAFHDDIVDRRRPPSDDNLRGDDPSEQTTETGSVSETIPAASTSTQTTTAHAERSVEAATGKPHGPNANHAGDRRVVVDLQPQRRLLAAAPPRLCGRPGEHPAPEAGVGEGPQALGT